MPENTPSNEMQNPISPAQGRLNALLAAAAARFSLAAGTPGPVAASTLMRYLREVAQAHTDNRNEWEPHDRTAPLILDLDGDGVEADGITYFDHEGDGWKELSRWAGEDDGVLVLDRNQDGVINDASELFSNHTVLLGGVRAATGFAALSQLDVIGDGVINAANSVWSYLRVMRWSDANNDGVMQAGEQSLVTLDSLGISSLSAAHTASGRVDAAGNTHGHTGSYTKTDGSTAAMADVSLINEAGAAEYDRSAIRAPDRGLLALPDLEGGGRVHSLRDAMILDETWDTGGQRLLQPPYYSNLRLEQRNLRQMVTDFTAGHPFQGPRLNKADREALAEKILLRWTGAESVELRDYGVYSGRPGSTALPYADARQIAVVEAFEGKQLREGVSYRSPSPAAARIIRRDYTAQLERLYGQLMLQSHLSGLTAAITVDRKAGAAAGSTNAQDYTLNFSGAKTLLGQIEHNWQPSGSMREEWLRSLSAVYGNDEAVLSGLRATAADWLYEYQYYADYAQRGVFGGEANRRHNFTGDENGNVFHTVDGEIDRLEGRGGNDIYYLNSGTGHDSIEELFRDPGKAGDANDMIKVMPGVGTARVILARSYENLFVYLLDENGAISDSLFVSSHFLDARARVEKVLFEDGSEWGLEDFSAAQFVGGRGTQGADVFDTGLDGEDTWAQGGQGSDVYHLRRAAGNDEVREADYNSGDGGTDRDVVRLDGELGRSDIRLSRSRNDLIIGVLSADGTGVHNTLTVKDYYILAAARIEAIELHDTVVWHAGDLDQVELRDTDTGEDYVDGVSGADVISGFGGGNDWLRGGGGNDVYLFGRDSDHDTVDERFQNAGSADDRVRLAAGLTAADVSLARDAFDLIINLSDSAGAVTDRLRIKNYYVSGIAKIERVELNNGTLLWDADDFAAAVFHDTRIWSDWVDGTADADVLGGFGGGNDWLRGGGGNDVYLFGSDSDHDEIYEAFRNAGSADDRVRLAAGLTAADVSLARDAVDLIINLSDSEGAVTDTLRVKNYYLLDTAKIERVELHDGTLVWDADDFAAAVLYDAGAENDHVDGRSGADVLSGARGGNDWLRGGGGNDVYLFGRDSDHDTVDERFQNFGSADDRVRLAAGLTLADVSLSRDAFDLIINLSDSEEVVTDTLRIKDYYVSGIAKIERVELNDGTLVWDADDFSAVSWTAPTYTEGTVRIRGNSGSNNLYGEGHANDVFDSDAGGNDTLYGYGGDDVYWLGRGTGGDTIREYEGNAGDAGDVIRIKSDIATADVRLRRSGDGDHLIVELLGGEGMNRSVTDSLTVANYYTDDSAKIERVELHDGMLLRDAGDFLRAAIKGNSGSNNLYGEGHTNDVFDGDVGGNDTLYGYGGDDVYWLGRGTGRDEIREYQGNAGDAGDVIRLKSDIAAADVRLRRSDNGDHLIVELLDGEGANRSVTDSLTVAYYYTDDSAKIERVELHDGMLLRDAGDFLRVAIKGNSGSNNLYGRFYTNDVFDSDAGGNDTLYGYGGDDVYWLGRGTGRDEIREYEGNAGDAGDVIRIKSDIAVADVRLRRSDNGDHLIVELLGGEGMNRSVTDSLTVAYYYTDDSAKIERVELHDGMLLRDAGDFLRAAIKGGAGSNNLYGEGHTNDVFDSDAGGNDTLYGYGGDDVYWLGRGTGRDEIREYEGNAGDAGDVIRIKSDIATADVRLRRSDDGDHLVVQLLDGEGANRSVTDSLTVANYYTDDSAKIERVELHDGSLLWDAGDFLRAAITGGAGSDYLYGEGHTNDVFDSDAGGNDTLYGYGGDDVYWLGRGTGRDTIIEHVDNNGDAGDAIRIKARIAVADIGLRRDRNNLVVELLNGEAAVADSLTVQNHFSDESAKIEQIEAAGQILLESQFQNIIDALAAFDAGGRDMFETKQALYDHYWDDDTTLGPSNS